MVEEIQIIKWDDSFAEGGDISDSMKNDNGDEFRKAYANVTNFTVEAPVIKRTDFKVLNAGEFMEQEFPVAEYIIDNLVGKGEIAVFGGDTGTGKTWVGLQCAYSLSM